MVWNQARVWILLAVATLLSAGLLSAQERRNPDPQNTSTTQSEKKPALSDAVRVSTDTALREAAKQEAKKPASEKATKESAEADVLEFRPADSDSTASSGPVVVPKSSKEAPLKDIHGTVYGSTDSKKAGTRSTGGSVGASSKSGKASIYVETERSRTNPPR